jgi:hypothetical protein
VLSFFREIGNRLCPKADKKRNFCGPTGGQTGWMRPEAGKCRVTGGEKGVKCRVESQLKVEQKQKNG